MMMLCRSCKEEKPEEVFSLKSSSTGKRNTTCKDCHRAYLQAHYRANPDTYKRSARATEARLRAIIVEAKSKPCADCGVQYPPFVMDFDHQGDKQFPLSRGHQYGIRRIVAEISKCEVVCANCHRIRTHGA